MLATMQPNSVASVALRAVRVDDSRSGKRKRCPPSNNERMDGKRVKVVYTATVPLKRWKLPRTASGHNGVFVLKTMAPSSNKPLCLNVNNLPIQKKSDDIEDPSFKIKNSSREKALAAQHGSSVLRTTTEARSQKTRTGTELDDSPMSEVSTGETTKDCLDEAMLLNGIVSTDCSSQQHVDWSGCTYTMISSPPYVAEKNIECSLQNTSTQQQHSAHTINHAMLSKDKHIQKTEEAVKHNGTGSDVELLEDSNGGCQETTNLVGDLICHNKNLIREKDDVLNVPVSSRTGPDRQDNVPPENNIRNPDIKVNDEALLACQNSGAAQTTNDDIQVCSSETDSDGKQKSDSRKNEPYGVTVKTISTRDLLKVLGQFNLTLKAVPMDRNVAENINSGSAKLRTFVADANGQQVLNVFSSAARDDVKTRIRAAIPLDSCALNGLKAKMQQSETSANRNNGFRKTPNGTFSNWRIKRPRFVQSSNMAERRHFHAGPRTKTANSAHVKRAETLKRREHRRFEQFRELQRRKNNGSKVSGAPHSQSTLQMIPLAKAFHDLEARDKATQETIETSNKCQTELTLKATSEEHFCPLSRAMESQAGDRSELSTDPMLTSVAFGSSESDSEDFANNDLVLFQNQIPQMKFSMTRVRSGLKETPNMLSELQEKTMSGGKSLEKTMARKNQLDDSADDDTKVPIGWSFLASDPYRSISNSSTQEMLYGKHKKTLSNRAIVVSSNGKIHSAESDLKIRKRTLSSSTSCDCSSDEYVTEDEFPCESTQIVTWDSKDDLDNSQLYKLKRKPVQDWNAKEVHHWLRRTIRQHERVKTSSLCNLELDNPSSPNADIHRLNLCGTLFSRVTDGAALCRLTSDKLHAFCGDESLSLYLYQRLQELVNEGKTKETAMYRDGYCAVSVPPTIPVTSAEQLEESVNIDDLLGSDNIFGSLELTEVLDSQAGSYLKSLGPEDEIRFPTQPTYISDKTLPALFNHFSPATRIPPYESTNFEQRQAYHRFLSPSSVNEYRAHCMHSSPDDTVSPFGRCHSFDVPNIECAYFTESVPSTPTLARSVSPSTFYNLPTVTESQPELVQNHKEKIQGTHPSTTGCSRDGAVSDSDSGIHSPDSTPNKHVIGASTGVKNGLPDYPTDSFPVPKYYQDSPTHEFCDAWSKQGVSMEVLSMPIEAAAERRNSSKDESSEDIWERTSTSSTVSALSIESETKLLNMDDYKTYTTKESSLAQQPGKRRQRENSMNIELHSPGEDFVLASLSETSAHGGFPIYASNSKCPKMANKGCTTTVYPAFVTQICRSNSASQACNSVPHADVMMGSFHRKYSESNGSDQMLMANMNAGSLPKKRGKIGADGSTTFRMAERRHTFNVPETSYIHPYELKIRRTTGKSVHLWEFIRDTLLDPQYCPRLIKWEDRKAGIFRFIQSDVVAGMWGEKKNNPKMTYEKLSRAMRYYYNRGILERVDGRRLVYKFGRNAHGWQQFGETNDSNSNKQTGVAGVKQEMATNSVFPQRRPRSNTKRKPAACRIAVSVTDDIVPFVKKRRRQISESLPNYVSVVTSRQSSTDTPKPPGLDEKIAAVQKSINLSNIKVEPQEFHHAGPTVSDTTTPATSAPASCIVYVARPERLTSETPTEKEVHVFETEVLPLSPEQCSDRPSKLPSADVLLGKQFKIAAATV